MMFNPHEKMIDWRHLTEGEPTARLAFDMGWNVYAARQPSWAGDDSVDETMVAIIANGDVTYRLWVDWSDIASKVNRHVICRIETYDPDGMLTGRRGLPSLDAAASVIAQHAVIDLDEVA